MTSPRRFAAERRTFRRGRCQPRVKGTHTRQTSREYARPHRPVAPRHGDAHATDNHHACHSEPVTDVTGVGIRFPMVRGNGGTHRSRPTKRPAIDGCRVAPTCATAGRCKGLRIAAPVCGLVRNDIIEGLSFHPPLLFAQMPACGSMWASTPTKETAAFTLILDPYEISGDTFTSAKRDSFAVSFYATGVNSRFKSTTSSTPSSSPLSLYCHTS